MKTMSEFEWEEILRTVERGEISLEMVKKLIGEIVVHRVVPMTDDAVIHALLDEMILGLQIFHELKAMVAAEAARRKSDG